MYHQLPPERTERNESNAHVHNKNVNEKPQGLTVVSSFPSAENNTENKVSWIRMYGHKERTNGLVVVDVP